VSWIALGVIVVLGSGLGFALWASSLGGRLDVLAVARYVRAGQILTATDVKVVRVGADPAVPILRSAELDRVVGRVAVTSIESGGLLRPSDLLDRSLIGEDRAVVGVGLKGGAVPIGSLRVGDTVEVVAVSAPNATGGTGRGEVLATATVFETHAADPATGAVVISLLVPRSRAVAIADAAGAERVRLVLIDQDVEGTR
jgi:hypothetical protein